MKKYILIASVAIFVIIALYIASILICIPGNNVTSIKISEVSSLEKTADII